MRPLLAIILGAVIAALLVWLFCYVIDHIASDLHWLCVVAIVVAIIGWIVWAFPAYTSGRWT